MKVLASLYFLKKYKRLARTKRGLAVATDKKIDLFRKNQNHPSLRLHKLSGRKIDQWSISIAKDTRIIFQFVKEGVLLVDIGSHKEVY